MSWSSDECSPEDIKMVSEIPIPHTVNNNCAVTDLSVPGHKTFWSETGKTVEGSQPGKPVKVFSLQISPGAKPSFDYTFHEFTEDDTDAEETDDEDDTDAEETLIDIVIAETHVYGKKYDSEFSIDGTYSDMVISKCSSLLARTCHLQDDETFHIIIEFFARDSDGKVKRLYHLDISNKREYRDGKREIMFYLGSRSFSSLV